MADNKFGEFGIDSPKITVKGRPDLAPTTGASKFGQFGLSGTAPKVDLGPQGEDLYNEEKGSLARSATPVLPIVGGIAGTIFGGPPGGVVGATTGQLMRSTLEKGQPLTPWEATKDAGVTAAMTALGLKYLPELGPVGSSMVSAIMGKGVNTAMNPTDRPIPQNNNEVLSNMGSDSLDILKDMGLNLGITLGMHGIAKGTIRNPANPGVPLGEELDRARQQIMVQGPSTKTGTPSENSTTYARAGQAGIRGNLARSTAIEKQMWDDFRNNHLDPNTETFQKITGYRDKTILTPQEDAEFQRTKIRPKEPIIEDIKIKGPIPMMKTMKLAQESLPYLDEFMKGDSYTRLPDSAKTKYINIYDTLKNLAKPTEVLVNGQEVDIGVKAFETVKDIRTTINQSIAGKPAPNFPQAQLKKVAEQLGEDLDTTITHLWKNGPEAAKSLDRANRATSLKKSTFTTEIGKRTYGKGEQGGLDIRTEADPEDFIRQAYQSPARAKRLMDAMGEENHAFLKGDYIDNYVLPKAVGKGGTKFNPTAAIDELKNPNSGGREVLTAGERNNLLRVFEAARATGEDTGNSLTFLKNGAQFNLGMAASKALTGNTITARVLMGAKEYFEYVRGNKQMADWSQRLIKLKPDSQEAQATIKLLMRGMRGSALTVFIDGKEHQGEVGENGKIKIAD